MISIGNDFELMIWICLIKNKNVLKVFFKSSNKIWLIFHLATSCQAPWIPLLP